MRKHLSIAIVAVLLVGCGAPTATRVPAPAPTATTSPVAEAPATVAPAPTEAPPATPQIIDAQPPMDQLPPSDELGEPATDPEMAVSKLLIAWRSDPSGAAGSAYMGGPLSDAIAAGRTTPYLALGRAEGYSAYNITGVPSNDGEQALVTIELYYGADGSERVTQTLLVERDANGAWRVTEIDPLS